MAADTTVTIDITPIQHVKKAAEHQLLKNTSFFIFPDIESIIL